MVAGRHPASQEKGPEFYWESRPSMCTPQRRWKRRTTVDGPRQKKKGRGPRPRPHRLTRGPASRRFVTRGVGPRALVNVIGHAAISICRDLAASVTGSVSSSIPFSNFAVTLSPSTLSGTVKLRSKLP